jgi:protein phosphatase
MRFSIYQQSQAGGRATNQDRMGYCFTRESLLLLLADGMGGHLHGELAATLTLQTMGALFQKAASLVVADPEAFLDELIYSSHLALHRYRSQNRLDNTPRTTIVACLVQEGKAQWAHCGDSRLYWVRGDAVLARTVDHAGPERRHAELVDGPVRQVLYSCIGAPSLPRVDVTEPVALEQGDKLLLCSDGLWGPLKDAEIARAIAHLPPHAATETLVRRAHRQAGARSDNLTALALEWQPLQKSIDDAHTDLDDLTGWVCESSAPAVSEPPTDLDTDELIAAITVLRDSFGPPVPRSPLATAE